MSRVVDLLQVFEECHCEIFVVDPDGHAEQEAVYVGPSEGVPWMYANKFVIGCKMRVVGDSAKLCILLRGWRQEESIWDDGF